MKAAELTNIREILIQDRPTPSVRAPRDVLIRVKSVGICGSDVHYYSTGRIGDQIVQFPWIVGHEMAGIVSAVGKEVASLKPGDRIALDPSIYCGECDQCRTGRYHTCRNNTFLGCPGQLEGCLAEYIVMPESACFLLPDSISFEDAALCEPLAIGMYAADLAGVKPGASAAILGAGPIGLSVLLAIKAMGAGRVMITDPLTYRTDAALSAGADWAGNPQGLAGELGNAGADYVFECCGRQEALDQAIAHTRPGGSVIIVGIPEFDTYSFDAHRARRQELSIRHVRRQNEFTGRAIEAVAAGSLKPHFMATHHFSIDETQAALDLVDTYGDGVIKAIIHV